jgi:hypothetical protein
VIRFASLAAAALACFVFPASAQVYKCTDKAGKTVYQDGPCDGSIPRPVAPPAAKSAESPDRAQPVDGMIAQLVYAYTSCTRLFPDLHAKSAMNYQAWRLKNSVAVAQLEALPEFQADLKRRTDQTVEDMQRQPGMRAQGHANCSRMLSAFDPASSMQAVPANVAKTPQEAWSGFIAAVAAGDLQKALDYVSPGSQSRYRPVLNSLGPDAMRNAVSTFGELKQGVQMGDDFASGMLLRKMPDGQTQVFEISFFRDRRTGGWVIESM